VGFFDKLKEKLGKTRSSLVDSVVRAFTGRSVDEELFEEIEQILIEADLGVDTAVTMVNDLRALARAKQLFGPDDLLAALRAELATVLSPGDHSLMWETDSRPHVTLVTGVNGSGKTTTVGKLAAKLTTQGKTVLLGAADTFRAAAIEQLTIWSDRSGADIIKQQSGSDPAAVAHDAVSAAVARGVDNLIVDTAGRLHTKVNLMEELRKIQRVITRVIPSAPHEVLLVLDATTGQNGLQQARVFTEALNVTGIVLTKLDGTAKGGIAVAIQKQLGIPIKMIGVGESIDDLQPFSPEEFAEALLSR
jgi:fused signal recognition particle receptor